MSKLSETLDRLLNPRWAWLGMMNRALDTYVMPGAKHLVVVWGILWILLHRFFHWPSWAVFVAGLLLCVAYVVKEWSEVKEGAELVRSIFDVVWAIVGFLLAHTLGAW